jgi:transcription elongation factor GreB
MSRGFVREEDQEEVPIVPPRAYLPPGVPNYVTRSGMDALSQKSADCATKLKKAQKFFNMLY